MKLWHYELLKYLPKSQLIAQKRECDLIWKDLANGKKTNHILINYIWSYHKPDVELYQYYTMLANILIKIIIVSHCIHSLIITINNT